MLEFDKFQIKSSFKPSSLKDLDSNFLNSFSNPFSYGKLPNFSLSPRKSLISQRVARFLVPGLFLLLLGLGNLSVGYYKGSEYREILKEISLISPESSYFSRESSALKRIHLTKDKNHRLEHRRENARARIDYYNLVSFGGKLMLSLSAILLLSPIIFTFSKKNKTHQKS